MKNKRLEDILDVIYLVSTACKYLNDSLRKIHDGGERDFLQPLSTAINQAELVLLAELDQVTSSALNLDMIEEHRFILERGHKMILYMLSITKRIQEINDAD